MSREGSFRGGGGSEVGRWGVADGDGGEWESASGRIDVGVCFTRGARSSRWYGWWRGRGRLGWWGVGIAAAAWMALES